MTEQTLDDAYISYVYNRGMKMPDPKNGSKFREETDEFLEALTDLNKAIASKKNYSSAREHLMEEAADVIFTMAAIVRKHEFTLEEAIEFKKVKDTGRNIRPDDEADHFMWTVWKNSEHVATFRKEKQAIKYIAAERHPEKYTCLVKHISSGLF